MKFNTIFISLALLALCLTVLSSNLKNSDDNSILKFFNNMYSTKTNAVPEKEKLKAKYRQRSLHAGIIHRFKQVNNTNSTEEEKEGILRISSYDFLNKDKYPDVNLLKKGEKQEIKTDLNRFRINMDKTTNPTEPNLDFFFRLNKDSLYYSNDKEDYNVLGSIEFNSVKSIEKAKVDDRCITITMNNEVEYMICSEKVEERNQWYCAMISKIQFKDDFCAKRKQSDFKVTPMEIEQKIYQPIILIPEASRVCNDKFNYKLKGSDWECNCSEGKEQSPINIETKKVFQSEAAPIITFDEVEAISPITTLDGSLMAKEHLKIKFYKEAIRIFHTKFGKVVTLDGTVYHCEEIVFHTPAEHSIDGVRSDMDMQVVCYGQSKGDISKQVVINFLFDVKPGIYNKFIDDVDFFNLPNRESTEKNIVHNLNLNKILYTSDSQEIATFKPVSLFTYQGSITSPPCTESTIHYVVKEPLPIARAVVEMLKEAIRNPDSNDTQEMQNARDTQPLNDRIVYYYDAGNCKTPSYEAPKETKNGHYEKVKKKITEYFYVNGSEPSGLPDSFAVSENEAKGIKENLNENDKV